MKAICYARFSPRPNAQDCDSADKQLERCRLYAAAHDHQIVVGGEYSDEDLSGATLDGRKGLESALRHVCKIKGILIVYSISRLARNTRHALGIVDRLKDAKAHLAILQEHIDTTSAMGTFTFTIFAALAALERDQIAERTSDAMLRHQANGLRMSRFIPYGWSLDPNDPKRIIACNQERQMMARAREYHDRGYDLSQIVHCMGQHWPAGWRGNQWNRPLVWKMLNRPPLSITPTDTMAAST